MKLFFKINLSFFIFWISFYSCNKLVVDRFNQITDPSVKNLLTQNYNYQRNTISEEEIDPPLELIFNDDYNGLPINGFSAVDSLLFFATGRGYLMGFNTNTNKLIGKIKLGLSASSPPTIYKNIIYQTFDLGDYGIIAYDVNDGNELWEKEKNLTSSSPIAIENKVFFQTNQGIVYCHNYLTGEKIWKTDLGCFGSNSIAFDEGILISANQDGAIFGLEYTSGIKIWELQINDKILANPVIFRDDVFIVTYAGLLYKINLKDGTVLNSMNLGIPIYFGVTVDDNIIYIPMSNGVIKAIYKNNFREKWSKNFSGPAASSVVISKNYAYFPTLGKYLYILDKTSGNILQEIKLNGRIRSVPNIKNGKLVIASEDENVNVFSNAN